VAALYTVPIFRRYTQLDPKTFIISERGFIALSATVFFLCLGFGVWIQFCKIALVILALQCVMVRLGLTLSY
jgi:hypothetical protein